MQKSNKILALCCLFVAMIAMAVFFIPVKVESGDVDKNNGGMSCESRYILLGVEKSRKINGELAGYIDSISGSRSPEYVSGTTKKATVFDLVTGSERIEYGPGSEYFFAYLKIKSAKISDEHKASMIERIRGVGTSEIASLNKELFGENHADAVRDFK